MFFHEIWYDYLLISLKLKFRMQNYPGYGECRYCALWQADTTCISLKIDFINPLIHYYYDQSNSNFQESRIRCHPHHE